MKLVLPIIKQSDFELTRENLVATLKDIDSQLYVLKHSLTYNYDLLSMMEALDGKPRYSSMRTYNKIMAIYNKICKLIRRYDSHAKQIGYMDSYPYGFTSIKRFIDGMTQSPELFLRQHLKLTHNEIYSLKRDGILL
jgi:hypothetical protein